MIVIGALSTSAYTIPPEMRAVTKQYDPLPEIETVVSDALLIEQAPPVAVKEITPSPAPEDGVALKMRTFPNFIVVGVALLSEILLAIGAISIFWASEEALIPMPFIAFAVKM